MQASARDRPMGPPGQGIASAALRLLLRGALLAAAMGLVPAVVADSADAGSAPEYRVYPIGWVRKQAGLDGVRLHDLRHLHATQLLAAGVPVRTVSGRLGHANAATTLNVYAHFLEASDRQAADVIGGLLD